LNPTNLARQFQAALELQNPPVALTFLDEAPEGVAAPPAPAPSACTFWREAETGTFYAAARDHYQCPVGSMVMGFELPEDIQRRLGELVGGMCERQYISADEPPRIPVVKNSHAGILYGPLADAEGIPDVVLLWVTPRQAMLCNEAMGTADWTAGFPVTTGRPGCAALPVVMAEGTPCLSFGCAGMRTFTGIGDDCMLVAIPGSQLEAFASALGKTVAVNSQMTDYYLAEQQRVSSGG
jgi:uncharacterized protein (DUF169 family)